MINDRAINKGENVWPKSDHIPFLLKKITMHPSDFYLRNPFLYQGTSLKINGVGLQLDSLHRNSPRSVTLPILFASITRTMIL